MSNGFAMCDNHTYLFATESKDCPYCEISRLSRDLSEITTANTVIRYERDDALAEISRLREEITRLRQYEDAVTAAKDGVLVVWNLMDTNSTVIANDYWQSHLDEIDKLKAELEQASAIANDNYQVILKRNGQINELKRQLAEAKLTTEDVEASYFRLVDKYNERADQLLRYQDQLAEATTQEKTDEYDKGFEAGLAASEFTDGYWLRCYAGQAMQGLLVGVEDPRFENITMLAVKQAKALLGEVKKHGE